MSDEMTIKNIDFSELSADDLSALAQRVNEAKVERLMDEQAPLRQEFHALMTKITSAVEPYGLTGQRFLSMSRPQLQKHLLGVIQAQAGGAAGGGGQRRVKVAPKYRNPDDPTQTWTGRGNRPIWVRDHLDAGGSLEEIAITPGDESAAD